MPVPRERAQEILRRRMHGESFEELGERLAPVPPDARPIPHRVPQPSSWSAEAHAERIAFLKERGVEIPHLAGQTPAPDPAWLQGNIEHYIGMAQIPVGLIGPLRINGINAEGDFYVPLATTEGTLVASYDRGARLITRAGGAVCLLMNEQVQRAPAFAFKGIAEAARFAAWAVGEVERFREIASGSTRHGSLIDMMTHVEANHVYLIFAYHTGDAAGQNMVTFCTAAICEDIVARTPVAPAYWFLESNMSGDKKATALSFLQTRGRNVTAEVVLPRRLVERGLRTTPERMHEYWHMGMVAGVQTGSLGASGHLANGITALFMACGQDVACVTEASVGITRIEMEGRDLRCTVSLPGLIVGTVGGGTRLPTARECLRIIGCEGSGGAARFAEICAAVALGGEISIMGAICAGEFAGAHQRFGRTAR